MILTINKGLEIPRPNLMAVLEDRGYKATAPRKAIAQLLEQKHGGFTLEALSEELPSVGRATVYRTVKLLLEAGLVCKVPMMDGALVYSLTRVDHRHYHSVCVRCGGVGEFKAATFDRLLRAIGADIPGKIVDHRIALYVTCDYCRADGGKQTDCSNPLIFQCRVHNNDTSYQYLTDP